MTTDRDEELMNMLWEFRLDSVTGYEQAHDTIIKWALSKIPSGEKPDSTSNRDEISEIIGFAKCRDEMERRFNGTLTKRR